MLGSEWLDETEIFNGSENSLVMVQSYTHEFQCSFKLQHYPFDTQVNLNISFNVKFLDKRMSSACKNSSLFFNCPKYFISTEGALRLPTAYDNHPNDL